jgi:predicted dehydrogenase
MSKSLSRREFVGISTAVAGAAGAAIVAPPIVGEAIARVAARGSLAPVRFGIIGVGMQGNGLLRESIQLSEVECVHACDLYDGRHVLAREIARPDLPVTRRYREVLANRDVDAVIVAVPDHWHRQIVIDALAAGKDVYCEKPFSHNAADGVAMVDAARKSGRIVQVGSQRVSSQVCAKAKELLAQGVIGDLTMIEAQLGRNEPSGAWQYPPPLDLSPQNLDWDTWLGRAPKIPFNPRVFAGWRAWREYGTGVAGDLLVHLVSGMIHMADLNRPPSLVSSAGAIRRWKDGRNTPDVHAVLFSYGDLPVSMRLNLGTQVPEMYRFHGAKGVLEVTSTTISVTPQSGKDGGPSYYASSFPRAMREAYQAQWRRENAAKPGDAVELSESVTFRGPHYDSLAPHLWNFFEAVRSRKPVVEDAVFGHNAALACHMANESYYRKAAVTWDENANTIRAL